MLDIDFGTYPYVTSSNTAIGGVCTGLGIPPQKIGNVVGVVKAYTTRVGAGPFPTELLDVSSLIYSLLRKKSKRICYQETGSHLQEVGAEFGTTTGRRRRCGWLDLVVLRHSTLINGYTSFNLTKLDVLDQLDELKIGIAYELDGKELEGFPADLELLGKVQVKYVSLRGWKKSIEDCRSYEELPVEAKEYIAYIEKYTGVRIEWIGVGPSREASKFMSGYVPL